jgi:hypothetical protein
MSETVLPVVTRIEESAEKAIRLHGEPGLLKTTTKQIKRFFYNLYPANWFNDFADIKITMEELSTNKNNTHKE